MRKSPRRSLPLLPFRPLQQIRVGIGVDMHPLVAGRPLWLGGVKIPFEKGLDGHSDGDCLTHAIVDAVLGAAGLGDIGVHFGASRPRYKHAKSEIFLRGAMKKVRAQGWRVGNLDATVTCEAPRLGPYFPGMKQRLARVLGVERSSVNLKATTAKGLGQVGDGEAIAVMAMVSLVRDR